MYGLVGMRESLTEGDGQAGENEQENQGSQSAEGSPTPQGNQGNPFEAARSTVSNLAQNVQQEFQRRTGAGAS